MDKPDARDLKEFTKEMLSEGVFSCEVCTNLLTVPVVLVKNTGNICKDCFQKSKGKDWVAIPNPKFDIILSKLQLPCAYKSEGCDLTMHCGDLRKHEDRCVFRSVDCFLEKNVCEWQGRGSDLFRHFIEEHPENVVNSPHDEFSFEINFNGSVNVTKMLNNQKRRYVLAIRELGKEKTLLHYIREDSKSTNEDLDLFIKYVGTKGQYKFPIQHIAFSSKCDAFNTKRISLSTIQQITDSSGKVKIVIKPKRCDTKIVNSDLLRYLECSICNELMRAPIFQCVRGHSFCKNCRERLAHCPTCRQSWGHTDIRNFALEELTSSVQYPREPRCLGNETDQREAICEDTVHFCPGSSCDFAGKYASCKNHFKLNHANDFVEGSVYKSKLSLTDDIKFFFEHGNVYKFTFICLPNSFWWIVRILNSCDEGIKYLYSISIINPVTEHRKVIGTQLCSSNNVAAGMENKISCPYVMLKDYRDTNHEITYCCEIIKEHAKDHKTHIETI